MAGEPKVGVSVAQPPSASGIATIGWAVVAIVAQLALVDAAIETFWRGSPVRWWVAPPVLVFVALSVWLWRPGGWAAKRWGWQGAASWSIGGLLLLLAGSSWLPEGQTNGVRMLLQPTATLLTLVTAAAVILAAFVLVRALSVVPATARMAARGVLIALAVYAVVALGLAMYERTPFAALFQGGAAWQRLPRWLQGTFIGALNLLPLAILGQIVRVVGHARRRQPVGVLINQAIALVMAFAMAVSGVTLPEAPPLSAGVSPVADAQSIAAAQDRLSAFLLGADAAGTMTDAQVMEHVNKALDAVGIVAAAIASERFEVTALAAKIGSGSTRVFEWVRDHTYLVPYRGTLRGATGVLMDRVGNSLDRALLLVALLRAAGLKARLARTTLSPAQASSLIAGVRPVPSDPLLAEYEQDRDAIKAIDVELAKHFGVDPVPFASLQEEAQAAGRGFVEGVARQADMQAAKLLALVQPQRDAKQNGGEALLGDHWWAQVEQPSGWVDLDPSLPTAGPGAVLRPATDVYEPDGIPRDLHHEVMVKVVIERLVDDRLDTQVVLAERLRPSELIGQDVTVQNLPYKWNLSPDRLKTANLQEMVFDAAGQRDWMPVLTVGKSLYQDKAFTTDGEIVQVGAAAPGATGIARELGGFLAGGEGAQEHPQALTAQWIDYETRVPGEPVRHARRVVFDLVGAAAREAGTLKSVLIAPETALRRAFGLLTQTRVLALPCRISPDYVAWLIGRASHQNREVFARLDGERLDKGAVLQAEQPPGVLYAFALARQAWNPAGNDAVLVRPNVVTEHRGVRSPEPGRLSGLVAIDIVENGLDVRRGLPGSAFDVRLRQGVFDSNVEAVLVTACCGEPVTSTASAYRVEDPAAPGWTVLRTEAAAAELRGFAPDTLRQIRNDLADGYVVVVSALAAASGGGWWRVNPRSGDTLGITSDGGGQAGTESGILRAEDPARIQTARVLERLLNSAICVATAGMKLYASLEEAADLSKPDWSVGSYVVDTVTFSLCVTAGMSSIWGIKYGDPLLSLMGSSAGTVGSAASLGRLIYARATRKGVEVQPKGK